MQESPNPYASPVITADYNYSQAGLAGEIQPASQGLRFANYLVDSIILQVISYPAGYLMGMAYATSVVSSGREVTPEDITFLQIIGFFVGVGISVTYYFLSELLCQRTLAKFLTGTKVVTADGRVPSAGQILGRTFARLIPFEPFSFFGGKGFPVGWHDSLSGTRVVKANA